MNFVLDIILVCLVFIFAVMGAKKGFAKTIIEIVGLVLSFVIAFAVANYSADYVYEQKIKPSVAQSVSQALQENSNENAETIDEKVDAVWNSIPPYISIFSDVSGLNKDSIKKFVIDSNDNANEQVQKVAISVCDSVVKPIAISAIRFVVTLVLLIVLLFLVKVISKLIGGMFNKSVFKKTNKFLGTLTGAIKGAIISVALVGLVSILLPLFNNEMFFITPKLIDETYIFKFIYGFISNL